MVTTQQAEHILDTYGSPAYVYDLARIRDRATQLKIAFSAYERTKWLYAIKANFNPTIVRTIHEQGFGIDAVSVEEIELAMHCGVAPEDIMFTGNNMTDAEMHRAHELGVLLNIGSLSRLQKFGQAYPGSNVSIRFNPNIGIASHETNITGGADSKFGISFRAVTEVQEICAEHNLTIIGIHQHIGSGWLRLREPLLALDVILDIARQIPGLQFVDVGGGFGVPYKPEEGEIDMTLLGGQIAKRVEQFCESYGSMIELRFEPGRYLVAEAGQLLTTVNTMKESISRKTIVGTDTGMNHLVRTAMYGSYHHIVNLSNQDAMLHEYDITGNICECADFFARDRMIAEIREGDILAILNAGAYGMTMATNYQFRPRPVEIAIDGEDISCIRRRDTLVDMMQAYDIT